MADSHKPETAAPPQDFRNVAEPTQNDLMRGIKVLWVSWTGMIFWRLLSLPRRDGFMAAHNGVPIDFNPFDEDTSLMSRKEWAKGWDEATMMLDWLREHRDRRANRGAKSDE